MKVKLTEDIRTQLRQAKNSIQDGSPEKAMDILFALRISELDNELKILSARFRELKKENRLGVITLEQRNAHNNQLLKSILELIDSLENEFNEEAEIIQNVNRYLKDRYDKRFSQKLAGRQPLNLRRFVSSEGNSQEKQEMFKMFIDTVLIREEVRTEITKTFEDAYGRLLITGQPGAGKTTLLIQLALGLLSKRQGKVPVILNLATWKAEYRNFNRWLQEILWLELGVSKGLAKQMLQSNPFILLLDGLDEVAENDRNSCLEAIGAYGAISEHQYVICSRIEEYKQTAHDAPVNLQIEIYPLTQRQIIDELNRIGFKEPEVPYLLNALKNDALLSKAIETPFYFNTAQLLFAGSKKWSDWAFSEDTVDGRKKEILERFVQMELNPLKEKKRIYPPEKTKNWLAFLAKKMEQDHLVNFELINLQPYWWGNKKINITVFGLVIGMIAGFPSGLIAWRYTAPDWHLTIFLAFVLLVALAVSISSWLASLIFKIPPSRLVNGMFAGFNFAALIAIIILWGGYTQSKSFLSELPFASVFYFLSAPFLGIAYSIFVRKYTIGTSERVIWSWQQFTKNWRNEISRNIISGIKKGFLFTIVILLLASAGLLIGWLGGAPINLKPEEKLAPFLILFFGAFLGSLFGFSDGLTSAGTTKVDYLQINKPYQRFLISLLNFNFSIFKHFTFRFLLYLEGSLPLRLVPFLEEMSNRNILESEGGRWRFRHSLIQGYFEKIEVEEKIEFKKFQINSTFYWLTFFLASFIAFIIFSAIVNNIIDDTQTMGFLILVLIIVTPFFTHSFFKKIGLYPRSKKSSK